MGTVVVLDRSLSMPMHDYWVPAKRSIVTLVQSLQGPTSSDHLNGIVVIGERARWVEPAELESLEWDYSYGSNLASALDLATAGFEGKPAPCYSQI